MSSTPRILIGLGSYHPKLEAAGSNQSIRALMSSFAGEMQFFTVGAVTDDDVGLDSQGAVPWHWDGLCQTTRVPANPRGAIALRKAVSTIEFDLALLNGFFDTQITLPLLALRRTRLVRRAPVIVSPRGEFAQSALELKPKRKAAYLEFCRKTVFCNDIWLHATGDGDAADIAKAGLPSRGVVVAPNLAAHFARPPHLPRPNGTPLRIAFLGRISPMKNLDFAIKVLGNVDTPVQFDLYGPISDRRYWEECQQIVTTLPVHVTVQSRGEIANDAVPTVLAGYDLFFMPTRGENFGHSIRESLMSGTPVLISDRTPWRNLERAGAGWDIPLSEPDRFAEVIRLVAMKTASAASGGRDSAREFAERYDQQGLAKEKTREMFATAMRG